MAAARPPIRWDRVGRTALLFVVALMIYLYAGPASTLFETLDEASAKREQVAALKARNDSLRARKDQLIRPSTLEQEARKLGMVRAGERAYVITNLP